MKKLAAQTIVLAFASLSVLPSLADDTVQRPEDFKPYKLVGDWKFISSNTGRNYSGDIEVVVNDIDSKGVMHGRMSYDGRQTNDQCSTKALFTDEPVEAEIVKSGKDYRITFSVNCLRGASPRVISWTLECASDGVCSKPDVRPWGKGVTALIEKR